MPNRLSGHKLELENERHDAQLEPRGDKPYKSWEKREEVFFFPHQYPKCEKALKLYFLRLVENKQNISHPKVTRSIC